MTSKNAHEPAYIQKLVDYNPGTGEFFWLRRDPSVFDVGARDLKWVCASWNARFAGTRAFNNPTPQGYLSGKVGRVRYNAHRVAYAMFYGRWPENDIDHINGVRTDNRIINLRDVPASVNAKNRAMNRNNTSGCAGVGFHTRTQNWRARITVGGRTIFLGFFDHLEDAVTARKEAEVRYGFHENHGRLVVDNE